MLYNLAVAFCVLKEHDKAKQSLQKASSNVPVRDFMWIYDAQAAALFTGKPPQLVLLSAYIQLAKGKRVHFVNCINFCM